jgi:hypothetical protein
MTDWRSTVNFNCYMCQHRYRYIKGIAYSLLSNFVSRNNDLDGYWAIGKFYQMALERGILEIDFDLLSSDATDLTTRYYHLKLLGYLDRWQLPHSLVAKANIKLLFEGEIEERSPQQNFTCYVIIEDDRGIEYRAVRKGYSRPHNPQLELCRNIEHKSV